MPSRDVRLSVTFVYSDEMIKHILNFLPSDSSTILVFPHQTLWQYSVRDPPQQDRRMPVGRKQSRFLTNIWHHRISLQVRIDVNYGHILYNFRDKAIHLSKIAIFDTRLRGIQSQLSHNVSYGKASMILSWHSLGRAIHRVARQNYLKSCV